MEGLVVAHAELDGLVIMVHHSFPAGCDGYALGGDGGFSCDGTSVNVDAAACGATCGTCGAGTCVGGDGGDGGGGGCGGGGGGD